MLSAFVEFMHVVLAGLTASSCHSSAVPDLKHSWGCRRARAQDPERHPGVPAHTDTHITVGFQEHGPLLYQVAKSPGQVTIPVLFSLT